MVCQGESALLYPWSGAGGLSARGMSSMAEQQQDHQLSSAASSIVGIDDFVAGLFLNDSPRDGGGGAGGGPTTPTFDLGPGTATEGDQGLVTEMEAFLGMSPGLREAHGAEQQTAQYLVPPLVYSPGPQMTAPPKVRSGGMGEFLDDEVCCVEPMVFSKAAS